MVHQCGDEAHRIQKDEGSYPSVNVTMFVYCFLCECQQRDRGSVHTFAHSNASAQISKSAHHDLKHSWAERTGDL